MTNTYMVVLAENGTIGLGGTPRELIVVMRDVVDESSQDLLGGLDFFVGVRTDGIRGST